MNYRDLDIQLRRSGRKYIAHVIRSDAGEASEQFSLPFTELEIENLILKLRPSSGNRGVGASNEKAAKELGGGLYNAVFQGEVALRLASCIQLASQTQTKVRIRLRLDAVPELASLPWEFLYDKSLNRFLSLSKETALVRYLDHPRPLEALSISAPLKVLVIISSPNDLPPLNVEAEWQKLQQAFSQLPAGLVEVHRLAQASLAELDYQLSRDNYHIFHYIGHGLFDEARETSSLALENEDGGSFEIAGELIGVHLHNHASLRMVILNACEGARGTTHDIYSGIAQCLTRCEIPAVIGMQFEISDKAAIAFSSRFYDAIARGKPVDESLDAARLAIHAAQNGGSEWGTPVLYLRAQDGNLFNVKTTTPEEPEPTPGPAGEPERSSVTPLVTLPRAAPNGMLSPNSPFYIERAAEKRAVELIQDIGITLTIIKPGQSGGSSLVSRLLEIARQAGKHAAYMNFQLIFTNQDFADAEQFYRRFCVALTNLLKVGDRVEAHWKDQRDLGIGDRCSYYLQYVLQQLNGQPLLLAMDEIDRLANAPFKSDFFAMVRSWHNHRAIEPDYQRLDLVLITSLEQHQLIDVDDHYQSPFNVGEVERFEDFSTDEVAELASRYGLRLGEEQLEKLISLLGGHPYLHQLALHHLAKSGASVEALIQQARNIKSPFNSHLEYVYTTVNGMPTLLQGVKGLLHPRQLDETLILQLRRAGLVQRRGKKVQFRCRLYEEYFREQFQ
jgi:AAA-like domain/CHAT domain